MQELHLSRTSDVQDIPVQRAKFGGVQNITLFFGDNHGNGEEDVTRISYLGFKGDWVDIGGAPQEILYEAAANPADHKLKGTGSLGMGSRLGGGH